MDGVVFVAVLGAALMHASWNALAKADGDRFSFMLVLAAAECALGAALYPFLTPPDAAALPWILASSALHVGYMTFLTEAYAHGDLAQVYPLSRGSAPLIVAIAGAAFLHEDVGVAKAISVACIGLGVMIMSMRGGADLGRIPPKALGFALVAACFTASYTICDALGARASHAASAYTCAMFAISGAGFVAIGFLRRGRGALALDARVWRIGAAAGALSVLSYWVAIWAFTSAPVAMVAALRETSVLMAMLIGVFVLGEHGGRWRWSAACLIAGGVVLMRL